MFQSLNLVFALSSVHCNNLFHIFDILFIPDQHRPITHLFTQPKNKFHITSLDKDNLHLAGLALIEQLFYPKWYVTSNTNCLFFKLNMRYCHIVYLYHACMHVCTCSYRCVLTSSFGSTDCEIEHFFSYSNVDGDITLVLDSDAFSRSVQALFEM